MPYLKITTNKKVENKKELLDSFTKKIAKALEKPEKYFMTSLEDNTQIYFQGDFQPAAFVELRSIGLPENKTAELSKKICDMVEEHLNVPEERVYINFVDIKNTMWGWNGSTF